MKTASRVKREGGGDEVKKKDEEDKVEKRREKGERSGSVNE